MNMPNLDTLKPSNTIYNYRERKLIHIQKLPMQFIAHKIYPSKHTTSKITKQNQQKYKL